MANQYDFFNLMKAGGYNPMDGGITTDEMDIFKTLGLINNVNKNKQAIENINKPFGMIGDSVQPNKPIINLPPVQQPNPQAELLKKQQRGNMLMALGDLLSGRDATAGFMQRKAGFDAQKERAERQAKQEQLMKDQQEFMKTLDPNSDLAKKIRINQLFGFIPSSPAQNKTTKSDFVVEILEKMKNNPGYKLTGTDQRILDTIGDTDPMKIMIRNRLNEMQVNNFSNENTNQSGPVTITTQEQYDALPSGSLFIEDGQTYRKP